MTPYEAFVKMKRFEAAIERRARHGRDALGDLYKPEDDLDLQYLVREYSKCLRVLVAS